LPALGEPALTPGAAPKSEAAIQIATTPVATTQGPVATQASTTLANAVQVPVGTQTASPSAQFTNQSTDTKNVSVRIGLDKASPLNAGSLSTPDANVDLAVRIMDAQRAAKEAGSTTDSSSHSSTTPAISSSDSSQTFATVMAASPATPPTPTTPTAAVAATVATASPAERAAVVSQLAQQVSALTTAAPADDGTQNMTVQIHPEQWGEVKIAITVQQPPSMPRSAAESLPTVTATITAATEDVRAMLSAQHNDLRTALGTAGLRLDKLDVVVATQAAPASSSQESGGFRQGHQSGNQSFAQQQSLGGGGAGSGGTGSRQFSSYGAGAQLAEGSATGSATQVTTTDKALSSNAGTTEPRQGHVDYRV
jgi:flagellar hook-length control protein FliK